MKQKLNKYAIVYFEDEDYKDNADNWMLVRYNRIRPRTDFYEDCEVIGEPGQSVFDRDSKIVYRTDLNKHSVAVIRDKRTRRFRVGFKSNNSEGTRFYLYIDKDDGDITFRMSSDEEAILYAMVYERES